MLKVYYLKLSLGVIFLLCLFTRLDTCYSEVVWSDNFDDGNLDDWHLRGNWSVTNNYAQVFYDPELGDTSNLYHDSRLRHPSQIAYGTWSFDLYLKNDKYVLFSFLGFGTSEEARGWNDYYFEIKPNKQSSGFYLGVQVNSHTDLDYREFRLTFVFHCFHPLGQIFRSLIPETSHGILQLLHLQKSLRKDPKTRRQTRQNRTTHRLERIHTHHPKPLHQQNPTRR